MPAVLLISPKPEPLRIFAGRPMFTILKRLKKNCRARNWFSTWVGKLNVSRNRLRVRKSLDETKLVPAEAVKNIRNVAENNFFFIFN